MRDTSAKTACSNQVLEFCWLAVSCGPCCVYIRSCCITSRDCIQQSGAVCRGAKIHSDSWGTGSSAYDALAYDVDLFSYVNQDFLPVFAAGNFGYEEVDSTVTSPSVSKNCLSVGKPLSHLL